MRKLIAFAALVFALTLTVQAQQASIFVGAGGVKGTSVNDSAIGNPDVGGGTFLNVGGQFLLHKQFGIEGEIAWRAHQNLYQGYLPFRPLFYDFNALYSPSLGKSAALDLMAGLGAESIRIYTGQTTCSPYTGSCTNYTSSNHFMGHFGAGVRLFVHGGFFIRPEAHLYLVRNNVEFSSGHAVRLGASIGYTFGER